MTFPMAGASQAATNPFSQLIIDCDNDSNKIQARYNAHRSNRNALFREKLLAKDFSGWQVDEILRNLILAQETAKTNAHSTPNENGNGIQAPFVDHRHNLNFYVRPPKHIREIVTEIQAELRDVAPTLWFSPPESLHITVLEVASSRTAEEVDALAAHLHEKTGAASKLVNYTNSPHHRARLVKPMLSYDASAMALSFLPAVDEPTNHSSLSDAYSYHHLRRDLAHQVLETGITLGARYVVPSAHVTLARFVSQDGSDAKYVMRLVERMEKVNGMLKEKYWPADGLMPVRGEWVIGEKEGLEMNKGTSWYGGGDKILVGEGFE
ncbi:RNA ligase/cyclic nucleotide phosphodiesterase [Aspergillus pseudodeflectus]|uniref:RNA ligase/cyclic nucleotide phosphodiesterase n=1 Tax=Aspergillus pseudodeflectus TaxID=176178 RepID=A0ABR4JEM9_9EURO